MARFARPENQATKVAAELFQSGAIRSLGTQRNDAQSLKRFIEHLNQHRAGFIDDFRSELTAAQREIVTGYLDQRSQSGIAQSTLDQDRQALQRLCGEKFSRTQAPVAQGNKATDYRVYTQAQVREIIAHQAQHNALATEIAAAAGLRAHELATLRPLGEQKISPRDSEKQHWSPNRFAGRDGAAYSVTGKGGLVREVRLPQALTEKLEQQRLGTPERVFDRGVMYQRHYNIGYGQSWSQSFSATSKREFTFSHGAHGLRHGYAEQRMDELWRAGLTRADSIEAVAQEMGHFRSDITEIYLR